MVAGGEREIIGISIKALVTDAARIDHLKPLSILEVRIAHVFSHLVHCKIVFRIMNLLLPGPTNSKCRVKIDQ